MSRRGAFALLALALLLAPPHAAAKGAPEYPEDLLALAEEWIAQVEALGEPYEDRPWHPEAEVFLLKAKEARDANRLRVLLFDLETYAELVLAGALQDEMASVASEAEKKALVLERTKAWADDARDDWATLRADLHAHDGQLRSLRSMERALYAADVGVLARLTLDEHARLSKELPKESTVTDGYVLALVRASHTQVLNLGWARDILETIGTQEGLPPRLNETTWQAIATASLQPVDEEETPPVLKPFLPLRAEAREGDEGILATAIYLAELRASRASSIQVIFGDGTSRGKDVVGDAMRNMGRRLENASMDDPRGYGLEGVMTADAMDRAAYTIEVAEQNAADLNLVVTAWAHLDHADFLQATLGSASPIQPASAPDPSEKDTPLPAALAPLALLGVALALRRRR